MSIKGAPDYMYIYIRLLIHLLERNGKEVLVNYIIVILRCF